MRERADGSVRVQLRRVPVRQPPVARCSRCWPSQAQGCEVHALARHHGTVRDFLVTVAGAARSWPGIINVAGGDEVDGSRRGSADASIVSCCCGIVLSQRNDLQSAINNDADG